MTKSTHPREDWGDWRMYALALCGSHIRAPGPTAIIIKVKHVYLLNYEVNGPEDGCDRWVRPWGQVQCLTL